MKRSVRGVLGSLLLLVFLVFQGGAVSVSAGSRFLEVEAFHIGVDILENGDALIRESVTFYFTGDYNGIYYDIDYERSQGMENLRVEVEGQDFLAEMMPASSPGFRVYVREDQNELARLTIHEPSSNERKTFHFQYVLKDVAEKYNDVGVFNRRLIGDAWEMPLNNIDITITIPEGASREELRVFAHGPLTGVSTIVDERTFHLTVPSVNGQFVETRLVFPRTLIPGSNNVFNTDELENILREEQQLADEANRQREEAQKVLEREERLRRMRSAANPVFGFLAALGLGGTVFAGMKFKKERKPEFEGEYYRELPGDYTPAVMTYLLTKGKVKDDDIMATLLDLARKRVIQLKPTTYEAGRLFKKQEDTYAISWLDKSRLDSGEGTGKAAAIRRHERFLAEWFIDQIGNGESLVLSELELLVKKRTQALQFQKDYEYFKKLVKDAGEAEGFFAPNDMQGAGKYTIMGSALVLLGLGGVFLLKAPLAAVMGATGLLLIFTIIGMNFLRKYAQRGVEQAAMWNAFKKFLLDFSNLKEAEVPSLVIWEHYLVYATALGVAKEVIDQLPRVFTEAQLSDPNLTYMGGYRSYAGISSFNRTMSNTMSKVHSAVNTAQIAASQKSSGQGFGGGFSGGSSGGGGGRGGGGGF